MESKTSVLNMKTEFYPEDVCSDKNDSFQQLYARWGEKIHSCMFDYLKATVSELGDDKSFYTTNLAEVLRKWQLWRQELPDVQMFYAIKANPDPVLLQFLVILGSQFDCATEGEIRAALSAGARPDQIIFANPNISSAGLRYAKKVEVDLMTFDSDEPLHRICEIYPRSRLLLRICPQDVDCIFDFSEKYGCRLKNASHLLTTAKSLGMDVVGVSFHVGSLNSCEDAFISSMRNARQVFNMASALGFHFSILDIGGGFQGSIGTDDLFRKTAQSIRKALSEYFPTGTVRVIAEPGCYVICSAVTLTTPVFSKRTVVDNEDDDQPPKAKIQYYLSNSIYSSFAIGIEEYGIHYRPLLREAELLERPLAVSTLYGQSLCPRDVLRRDIPFPEMRVGESVVWSNMGAYSQSICSRFCSFPLPLLRYVFRKETRLRVNWIKNLNRVATFLADFTQLIGEEGSLSNDSFC